jgi:hypothetical protein
MTALLAHRTWYTIRSASLAHGLGFNTNLTREQGREHVRLALLDGGRLKRAFQSLTPLERDALAMLQAAGGAVPHLDFTTHFGDIRAYRPWRAESPQHPWKEPISAAEKLWHLAFIEIMDGQVILADEVLALLPPLPVPRPIEVERTTNLEWQVAHGRDICCRDVTALLSLAGQLKTLGKQWLSRGSLVRLNQRLHQPESLDGISTERQTGRPRFLHYLADVAGLLVEGQVTTAGWSWLRDPGAWEVLLQQVNADLRSRQPRWLEYELPPLRADVWQAALAALFRLHPGTAVSREAFWSPLRHLISRDRLNALLDGPLQWLGLVVSVGDALILTQPGAGEQATALIARSGAFYLPIPALPKRRAWVAVSAWAEWESGCLRVDAPALIRAAEMGVPLESLLRDLADLTGKPLSAAHHTQLTDWMRGARRLTLRPLLVLTAQDEADLQAIRADWRLRPLLGEALSAHHVVVQAAHLDELRTKLNRRGYPVQSVAMESAAPSLSDREYAYLTARTCQLLGGVVEGAIPVPGRVVQALGAALTSERRSTLDQAAHTHVEAVRRALQGQVPAGSVAPDDSAGVRLTVESALRQGERLTIHYFSPARGEQTTRTIEPILLYDRNGATYLEAWCHLDGDTRTFRLDRILRIITDGHT